ncbi:MAG: hypothetical protein HY236_07880 [Acidobacteria bacterium]|nr:hypothetical protein [Acidobacteriota bacterium]
MRRRFSFGLALFLGTLLTLSLGVQASAKGKKAKESRFNGTVHSVDKNASLIVLRRGTDERQVVYNANTKFTYQNKDSSIDEVKEGRRVICLGDFNDKKQLVARQIDVREGR